LSNVQHRESDPILMRTGIKALDRFIGGYRRGQLVCTLGGLKAGKTWWLMHTARAALLQGLKVVHISHEVQLDEMETRYDMMFSGRGSKNVGQYVKYIRYDHSRDEMVTSRIKIKTVYDPKKVMKARHAVLRFGGSLRIKKYPMGQCSPAEIERYLNYLESFESLIPDVLIIDYLDIMDLSSFGSELRHQLNSAYIWAKGIADERNILVLTVSQVTRAALKRRKVTAKDVAEDVRKGANVDLMLAIGRGEEEVDANLAGINIIANRSGVQDRSCTISLCFDIGQFCLSSWIGKDVDEFALEVFGEDE